MLSLLLARDASRTAKWLQEQKEFSAKATEGYSEIVHEFERVMARDDYQAGVNAFFEKGHSYYWWSGATHWYYLPGRARLVARLINLNLLRKAITTDAEPGSRAMAMYELVKRQPDEAQSWSLVCERATADNDLTVRLTALKILTDAVTADARLRNLVHVGRRTSNGPDPKEPVQNSFAQSTAARLNLSIPQVQTSFEELATALRARFEFALRLAWKV